MKPKEMLETPVQRRRGTVTRETGAIALALLAYVFATAGT